MSWDGSSVSLLFSLYCNSFKLTVMHNSVWLFGSSLFGHYLFHGFLEVTKAIGKFVISMTEPSWMEILSVVFVSETQIGEWSWWIHADPLWPYIFAKYFHMQEHECGNIEFLVQYQSQSFSAGCCFKFGEMLTCRKAVAAVLSLLQWVYGPTIVLGVALNWYVEWHNRVQGLLIKVGWLQVWKLKDSVIVSVFNLLEVRS